MEVELKSETIRMGFNEIRFRLINHMKFCLQYIHSLQIMHPRIASINYFLATYLKLLDHFVLHHMKICVN
jgi:hypothetical protein